MHETINRATQARTCSDRRGKSRFRFLSMAYLASLFPVVAGAQVAPTGPQFQVNTYTTGTQSSPSVALSPTGAFTVVFASLLGSGGTDDRSGSVHGQRFAVDGTGIGSEFQANTYTTGLQGAASIAAGAAGGFVVTWGSFGSTGTDQSDFSVQAQLFDADGIPHGAEFQVNTYTTSRQFLASVAAGPAGGFVVVWESNGTSSTDASTLSIQGQRFDSDGVPVGSEFQVNTYTTGGQRRPSVAVGPAGEFVVVWESERFSDADGSSFSVHGQRFGADGMRIGGQFQLNSYTTAGQ